MRAEAEAVVQAGAPDAKLVETRTADMRYRGQGHEITVDLPPGDFTDAVAQAQLIKLYEDGLRRRPSAGPSRASTSRS